jgi:hypothetical protein
MAGRQAAWWRACFVWIGPLSRTITVGFVTAPGPGAWRRSKASKLGDEVGASPGWAGHDDPFVAGGVEHAQHRALLGLTLGPRPGWRRRVWPTGGPGKERPSAPPDATDSTALDRLPPDPTSAQAAPALFDPPGSPSNRACRRPFPLPRHSSPSRSSTPWDKFVRPAQPRGRRRLARIARPYVAVVLAAA